MGRCRRIPRSRVLDAAGGGMTMRKATVRNADICTAGRLLWSAVGGRFSGRSILSPVGRRLRPNCCSHCVTTQGVGRLFGGFCHCDARG